MEEIEEMYQDMLDEVYGYDYARLSKRFGHYLERTKKN